MHSLPRHLLTSLLQGLGKHRLLGEAGDVDGEVGERHPLEADHAAGLAGEVHKGLETEAGAGAAEGAGSGEHACSAWPTGWLPR